MNIKKKPPLTVVILSICILLLSAYLYSSFKTNRAKRIELQKMNASLNGEDNGILCTHFAPNFNLDDYLVSDYKVTPLTNIDNRCLDPQLLVLNISSVDSEFKTQNKIIYKVIDFYDVETPKISLNQELIDIDKDEDFDMESNIKEISDNYSLDFILFKGDCTSDNMLSTEEPVYCFSGDFDNRVAGKYSISVFAKDSTGNLAAETFSINVVDKIVENETYSSKNDEPIFSAQQEANIQPSIKPSIPDGAKASISVGTYTAALYGDGRIYDTKFDSYIDAENAAPYYSLPSGAVYIPDHNFQGFSETLSQDSLTIFYPDGSTRTYSKASSHRCAGDSEEWISYDGVDIWYNSKVGLVTQTCVDNDDVMFVFWN